MSNEDQCQPMRMKYWKELDEAEKVERMRDIVRSLRAEINRQTRIIDQLATHQHGVDGKPVAELAAHSDYPPLRMHGGEEDYF